MCEALSNRLDTQFGLCEELRTRHVPNTSLICAHALTEEKDNAVKDAIYANLEDLYDNNKNPMKA